MPEDQQPPTKPDPVQTNKQDISRFFSNKKKIIFLFLVFIFFLFATSAITLRKSQTKTPKPFTSQLEVTPTPRPSNISLQDETPQGWKTYRNEKQGFQIKYPEKLTLLEENGSTKLSHTIPYKHQSPCAMVGNEPPIDNVTDFSLTIEVSQKDLGETVATQNPFIKDEGYIKGNNLTLEPGFIDRYETGTFKGYKITSGAECGIYEYFFPIVDDSKTLIVTRSWELTTEYAGLPEVLNLPGLITNSENEKLFTQILSTFKFTNNRKVTEQKLPNGIVSECKTDSECVAILSNNNCNLYCVNNTPSNQQIIQSLKKTCDATLWDPPLSLECGCISNICQLYE